MNLNARKFYVGDCLVDSDSYCVTVSGVEKRLEPKLVALLCYLASHQGEVLSREQIAEHIWPNVVVGDDSINRSIFALRNALGDDAKNPRYIETISRKGYRLLARVTPLITDSGRASPADPHRWGWGIGLLALLISGGGLVALNRANEHNLVIEKILPITQMSGSETDIALEQKTGKLVYIHTDGKNSDVYVTTPGQANAQRITEDDAWQGSPQWLNTETIVYIDCHAGSCRIVQHHSSEEERTLYTTNKRLLQLTFSAAQNGLLLFTEILDKTTIQISSLNLLSGETTLLQNLYPQLPKSILSPVLSRYGNKLFFTSGESSSVSSLDFTLKEVITHAAVFDSIEDIALWDETRVLLAGSYHNAQGIWLLDLDEQQPEMLLRASGTEKIFSLEAAPASKDIYYANYQRNLDIGLISHRHEQIDPLPDLNSNVDDFNPIFDHSHKQAFFISTRSGHNEIWQYNFVTRQVRQVSQLNAVHVAPPALSRNGRFLAVAYRTTRPMLAVISVDTGAVLIERPVAHAKFPLNWSKDDRYFYASEYTDRFNLYQFDLDRLQASLIKQDGWLSSSDTLDGQSVVFAVNGLDRLSKKHKRSSLVEVFGPTIPGINELILGQLQIEEKFAYAVKNADGYTQIVRYALTNNSDSDIEKMLDLPHAASVSHIRNDGKAVFINQTKMPWGDIMQIKIKE